MAIKKLWIVQYHLYGKDYFQEKLIWIWNSFTMSFNQKSGLE